LNLYLIQKEGAYGAAFTATITNIAIGVLNLFVCVKVFRFKVNYWLIVRLVIFSIACILIFYAESWLHMNWMVEIVIYAFTCVIIAFLLGLLEIRKIMSMIRPKALID
jgi:hypothetical protein